MPSVAALAGTGFQITVDSQNDAVAGGGIDAELLRLGATSDASNIYLWVQVGQPSPSSFDPTLPSSHKSNLDLPVDFTDGHGIQYSAHGGWWGKGLWKTNSNGWSGTAPNVVSDWMCNELRYTIPRSLVSVPPVDGEAWTGMMATAYNGNNAPPYTPIYDTMAAGSTGGPPGTGAWTVGNNGNVWQNPPTVSAAAIGDNAVRVTWMPAADNGAQPTTLYRVYRSVNGALPYALVYTTPDASVLSYDDGPNLVSGTTYSYQVAAVSCAQLPTPGTPPAGEAPYVGGEGLRSASATITPEFRPQTPAAFALADATPTSMSISWQAVDDCPASTCTPAGSGASGVAGYTIYAGPSGGQTALTALAPAAACTGSACAYTHSGLATGTALCYYVEAFDAYGAGPNKSVPTAEVCGVAAGAPAAVADTFAAVKDTLFAASACAASVPAATGGPYHGVLCNDQDAVGHDVKAILVTAPTGTTPGGSFSWDADGKGGFSYQAATGSCGGAGDSFTYRLHDVTDDVLLNTVTVQIDVACPPEPVDDVYAGTINTLLTASACAAATPTANGGPYNGVLCNDQDDVGHELRALLVTAPAHSMPGGFFAWDADNKGGFAYRGATDWCGVAADSLQYRLEDVTAGTLLGVATVQLDIGCIVNEAPVAACAATSSAPFAPGESVTFGAAGSSDSDGTIASWSWTFSGATPASSAAAAPTTAWPSPGTFAVTLVVTDDDGAASEPVSCDVTVTNTAPSGVADFVVVIKDGSLDTAAGGWLSVLGNDMDSEGNLVAVQEPLCAYPNGAAGTLTSFTFTGPSAGHFTFVPAAGFVGDATFSYRPKDAIAAVPAGCTTVTLHVQENHAPSPAFSANPWSVVAGEPVAFVDASNDADPGDAVIAWSWNFGDGRVSVAAAPSHAYEVPGSYTACLAATDTWGAVGSPVCRGITVKPRVSAAPVTSPPGPDSEGPAPPQAADVAIDAGDDARVTEGSSFQLRASVTGADAADVQWIQTYGPKVELTGSAHEPTFVAPGLKGWRIVLYFEASIDTSGGRAVDGVTVVVESKIASPEASALSVLDVAASTIVVLDGTASTSGTGAPLVFRWTQWEGPLVDLEDADTPSAVFRAPSGPAILRFALEVSDGHSSSVAIQTVNVAEASSAEPYVGDAAAPPKVQQGGNELSDVAGVAQDAPFPISGLVVVGAVLLVAAAAAVVVVARRRGQANPTLPDGAADHARLLAELARR